MANNAINNMNILAYFALASALLISVTVKAEGMGESFTSFAGFQLGAVKLANIQSQLGNAKVVNTRLQFAMPFLMVLSCSSLGRWMGQNIVSEVSGLPRKLNADHARSGRQH